MMTKTMGTLEMILMTKTMGTLEMIFMDSGSTRGGGGVRGYSIKFYTGRLLPEVQTPTLKYNKSYQNGTPFIYLEQSCTPFLYLKVKPEQYLEFSLIAIFFSVFQSFWFSCSKDARFYVFRFVISTQNVIPLISFALASFFSNLQLSL